MHHYLYRVVQLTTGRYYIGVRSCQCVPVQDSRYIGTGVIMRRMRKKHGLAGFSKTILGEFSTREEAEAREAQLVDEVVVADPDSFNLMSGGRTRLHAEQTKERLRKLQLGRKSTEETKMKLRISHLGLKASVETKALLSARQKERYRSPEARKKSGESHLGFRHSEESKAKMSRARLGMRFSEETRRRIGEVQVGRKHSMETRKKMSESAKRYWGSKK